MKKSLITSLVVIAMFFFIGPALAKKASVVEEKPGVVIGEDLRSIITVPPEGEPTVGRSWIGACSQGQANAACCEGKSHDSTTCEAVSVESEVQMVFTKIKTCAQTCTCLKEIDNGDGTVSIIMDTDTEEEVKKDCDFE